ncbi:MAG: 50S ribosomal protein L18 [Flavobacteriaceae bacterium]|jgi:large subunit ribosomal protein L18|nr:50S ribosomal protein L18 [Flavobacteriaceae bacterium]|tara:strand:+ start:1347 stop:1703 length:357 start_codon:yes stop_codon:yes gene_type:complete
MRLSKRDRRTRIKNRIRKIISGTESNPRLSVFRSNKEIYAQLIDDSNGKIIVASSSRDKNIDKDKSNKTELASLVGKDIAEKAIKKGIKQVSFDRSGYLYHGRVKSLADGAREVGLKF